MQIENYYKKYVEEGFDENGVLNKFKINCPDDYNFGYDTVDKYAEIEPDRRTLFWVNLKDETRQFSFGELSRLSNKAANFFLSLGIKKGDKVMVVLKRDYQFWYAMIGLMKIGAVAIPATHLLVKEDFIYRFELADVRAIICTEFAKVAHFVEDANKESKVIPEFLIMANGRRDGWHDFDAEIENFPDTMKRVSTHKDEPMLMYFTSGTTGYPKMVVHRQEYPLWHILTAKYWQNVDPKGMHLTVSETGWAKSVWGKLYGQMLVGTTVFVYDFDKFDAAKLLTVLEKYKVTTFCAPPTIYRFFIQEGLDKYDLSSLKYSTIAGEPLNAAVYDRWLECTGLKLMEVYGQTETTPILANLVGQTPIAGSMGKPTPLYDVDLVDESGQSVPPNTVGEIVIHAKAGDVGIFSGYHNNAELNAEAFRGGMYHTGDTAWRDENGYYWYEGRKDDLIKASGYRIGPFEVESVLIKHPAVLECAVTGAPDPIRGQVVKATIVLMKGHTPSDELAKELKDHVKAHTAPYKYPRIIEFATELPKTISGKIRRVEIREKDNNKQ